MDCKSAEADHVASHIGRAQGISLFLKGVPPLLQRNVDPGLPMDLLQKHGLTQESFFSDAGASTRPRICAVVHEMAAQAGEHLKIAEGLFRGISDDKHRPIVPVLLAPLLSTSVYLSRLERHSFDPFSLAGQHKDGLLPLRMAWRWLCGNGN